MTRTFAVERRALPLKADLETKFERAIAVVGEERSAAQSKARVESVLAILKAEPQAVQEGIMAGLRDFLGKKYAQPSRKPQETARQAADAVFKAGRAA
jgi:uncharacterized protein (DUF2267 family)